MSSEEELEDKDVDLEFQVEGILLLQVVLKGNQYL